MQPGAACGERAAALLPPHAVLELGAHAQPLLLPQDAPGPVGQPALPTGQAGAAAVRQAQGNRRGVWDRGARRLSLLAASPEPSLTRVRELWALFLSPSPSSSAALQHYTTAPLNAYPYPVPLPRLVSHVRRWVARRSRICAACSRTRRPAWAGCGRRSAASRRSFRACMLRTPTSTASRQRRTPKGPPPPPFRRRTPKGSPWLPPPSAAYAPARRLRLLRGRVEERRGEQQRGHRGAPGDSRQLGPLPRPSQRRGRRHGAPRHTASAAGLAAPTAADSTAS